MSGRQQDDLSCTFADAERNNLTAGIRMSTRAKVELFEDMLDFAWRAGTMKSAIEAAPPNSRTPATARTSSLR